MSSLLRRRLYDCFSAPDTCVYGFCCLPCLYGQNVDREENNGCFVPCCVRFDCCSSLLSSGALRRVDRCAEKFAGMVSQVMSGLTLPQLHNA